MWQLLQTITETINTLFPVVNFLKRFITKVVSFSLVAFMSDTDISQGSEKTHLRCDGIFNNSIITNFLLVLTVK